MSSNPQRGARCARCAQVRQFGDPLWDRRLVDGARRLVCEPCKHELSAERRKQTGARLLGRGRDGGTSEYGGTMMHVTILPEKKRHR